MGAAGVVLPGRLGFVGRAAAARTGPATLGVPPGGGHRGQRGATDSGDVLRRRGVLHPVAAVTRAGRDRDPRMTVVAGVVAGLSRRFRGAVAVGHRDGTQPDGGVDRRPQIGQGGGVGLHQQDLAVRAGRRHHVQVQHDLLSPASVRGRRRGPPVLVHLAEAATGAGRQPVLRPVGVQVALRGRQVVGVHGGDRPAATGRTGGQLVGRLLITRSIPARRGGAAGQRSSHLQVDDRVARSPMRRRRAADPGMPVPRQPRHRRGRAAPTRPRSCTSLR